jgi:DNA polymerase-3 subunit alpha (Gram-positive type)
MSVGLSGGPGAETAADTRADTGVEAGANAANAAVNANVNASPDILRGLLVSGVDYYQNGSIIQFQLRADQPVPHERVQGVREYLTRALGVRDVGLLVSCPDSAPVESPAIAAPAPPAAPCEAPASVSAQLPTPVAAPAPPPALAEAETAYEFAPAPPPATGRAANAGATGRASRTAGRSGAALASKRKAARDELRAGDFGKCMKGIALEGGAYFELNPDILCGGRITAAATAIAELATEEQGMATVAGEVVNVGYKTLREGASEVLECGLSDGTGSIIVKQYISREYLQYVKPRLQKGRMLAVYGQLRYDKYLREVALYAADMNFREKERRADTADQKRVELHMHTQMSAMDAVTPVEALVKQAAEWGHPAVAVTDHGVVQAFPDAYSAGRSHKIKVIFGIEAYLTADEGEKSPYHVILLVKNQTGLKNLYKLVSKSHLEYYYKRPRMPRREIEAHREGLLVGSACEAGELFTAVLQNAGPERLREIAAFYDYLEIQPIENNQFLLRENKVDSLDALRAFNETIVRLGEETGKPVAATCDVHFIDMGSEVFRRILMSGQGYHDAETQPPLYFRTTDEMLREFAYLGAKKAREVVVENPNLINSWIDEGIKPIPDGTFTPKIEGAAEELKRIVEAKAAEIYGDPAPAPVRERLDRELDTIVSKEFSVLYMIAHKLVKKSNEDGYIVGSRGSVGSSLVATLAGITEVNPLPPHYVCPACRYSEFAPEGAFGSGFDLPSKACPRCGAGAMRRDGQDILFEIFLGAKGSEKAPDIDLNFSGEYQATAHKYTEELFGAGNVFKAGTIGTIAKKTAYGFVKKYLESKGRSLGAAEEDRLTEGCTGVKRTTGQHPGGIVVIPQDCEIYDFTPIQRPADAADTDIVTTHFDFNSLHDTILKLDILGHDDPSMIRMLEDLTGVPSGGIEVNDERIMSLFLGTEALGLAPGDIGSKVGTLALPEFGTKFVRQMLVDARPKNFSDLLQVSGLSHGTNVWLNNAQDLIRNGICTISEVIGTRESLVLYLMSRGLETLTAFNIMEAVRKNRGVTPENEQKMLDAGVPEWYIASCKKIEYLFPKAHAAAYVQMAYRQAWYKINTPVAFYTAYFSIRADDFDAEVMTRGPEKAKLLLGELNRKGREATAREQSILTILEVVIEMYARGIRFLPIDIYRSDASRFTIEDGAIRPPLTSLQGLGMAAALNLAAARANGGAFISVEDMAMRAKASKTVVEILRSYGALAGMADESQMTLYELICE